MSLLAVAVPFVCAYQQPPAPAFYSQVFACGLWASVVLLAALAALRALRAGNNSAIDVHAATAPFPARSRALWAPSSSLWLLLIVAILGHVATGLTPAFLAAPALLNLTIAWLIGQAVFAQNDPQRLERWFRAVLAGILLAALYNALVALVQLVAPNWTNEIWFASAAPPGDRAGGNLRQPNQLATLMVWGLLAAIHLLRGRGTIAVIRIGVCLALLLALLASGSRAGVASLLLVVLAMAVRSPRWRSAGQARWWWLVLAAGLIAAFGWLALGVFKRATADASLAQRLALWRETITLIGQYPWTGVGWAQLNFAWTLTPFAGRAPDVFDHAHSLPLHLAVELGVPLATLLLTLLAAALWRARRALTPAAGEQSATTALLLLAVILLHSLFEYPLWFSYFLLPSAFLLAWLARMAAQVTVAASPSSDERTTAPSRAGLILLALASSAALAATVYGVGEYRKASAIHRADVDDATRNQIVKTAQASALFGHYGDYAAIMLAGDSATLPLFARPIRNVLDERLLTAYARALQRAGESERAAFIVARANEFPPDALFAGLPLIAAPATPSAPAAPASAPASGLRPRDFTSEALARPPTKQ